MGIKRSTYYYQVKENNVKGQQEIFLKEKIQEISYEHPYYDYRRITVQLQRENITINHKRVLHIIRQLEGSRPGSNAVIPSQLIADIKTRYTSISSKIKQ